MNFKPKALLVLILFLLVITANSQTKNPNYLSYIDQYCRVAAKQQAEHGIPASIVLAQGLLESGAGRSELASKSNNHFGIKCSDWTGKKVYHDDDERGECFRKYDSVLDSYEDHSLFLKNRSRYAFLFELSKTDYEGWAFGLKKAGYATDPSYGNKLITIIENYNLHQYDLGKGFASNSGNAQKQDNFGSIGSVSAFANHEVYKINRVKFVRSERGDTYKSIGDEFHIREHKIRDYNEVSANQDLKEGTRVYIALKKRKAARGFENYIVKDGDSMVKIANDYGIRVDKLYKLNKMAYTERAKFGQVLKLR